MIRVGIVLADRHWQGGINYFRNLLLALDELDAQGERRIEPVLITTLPESDKNKLPARLQRCETLHYAPPSGWLAPRINCRIARYFGHDPHLTAALRRSGIEILSHATSDLATPIPALGWIPDFQHLRRPDFFTPEDIALRSRLQRKLLDNVQGIILSSNDALGDLVAFAPDTPAQPYVLPFAVTCETGDDILREGLEQRHGFSGPFLFVPNQFWRHKNHALLIEALRVLKDRGSPALIVATGGTHDPRHPEHFQSLLSWAEELGVAPWFRPLGKIPFADVVGLMRHCVAVINPSYFEGWSTTVEESRCMGKRIILSDLPIHREQAPERALYVDPDNPEALADAIQTALREHDQSIEEQARTRGLLEYARRRKHFGETYQAIVLDCMERLGRRA